MTLERIPHSVSGQRTAAVTAALGVAFVIIAAVAVFANAATSEGEGATASTSLTHLDAPSVPGVLLLTRSELIASAFTEHEAYMEALFGPYTRAAWVAPVDLALAKGEHDRSIDAVLFQ